MGLWGKMYLEPGLRDFLFRYAQGRLHVNQARAAYDPEQEPYCSFCTIRLEREFRATGREIDSIKMRKDSSHMRVLDTYSGSVTILGVLLQKFFN